MAVLGAAGQATIRGLIWELLAGCWGLGVSLGILRGSQKFPRNGWVDRAHGWACVHVYTGVCLRPGEVSALCAGRLFKKSCQALSDKAAPPASKLVFSRCLLQEGLHILGEGTVGLQGPVVCSKPC